MTTERKVTRTRGEPQQYTAGIPEELVRAAEDLATSVSFMPGGEASGLRQTRGELGTGQGVTAQIDLHLRALLGRLPTSPKNFFEALDRSIELSEEEGHTVWQLASRSGVGALELGTGGPIPAVQAIMAKKAGEASAIVGPIVKRLPNLNCSVNDDEVDAVRANFETEFQKLVEELGREQGIRKERADTLFENILGDDEQNKCNHVDPDSLFGVLATKAGYVDPDDGELNNENVSSLEEEQHLADLVIMRGTLLSFRESYRNYRDSANLFFSDRLFYVNRALLAIQETTQAVEQALDSVALGEFRRQMLPSNNADPCSMKLQDLLDWASDFASEEAPQILERGGRFGLQRLNGTLRKLEAIIAEVNVADSAFTHARVGRAWAAFKRAVSDASTATSTPGQRPVAKKKPAKSTE